MESPLPTTSFDGNEVLTFRYVWPLRIAKRLMTTGERAILHVSSPFCTAYNGCQFTWLLRMCDQRVLEMANLDSLSEDAEGAADRRRVNVTLYYKEGPTPEVTLDCAFISVTNSAGKRLLKDTPLEGHEYVKGSGWSPSASRDDDRWLGFSEFVHQNVGSQISVVVDLRIKAAWFQPLNYLPSLDSTNSKLESLCERVLKEVFTGHLEVPDLDLIDPKLDRFSYHRRVFNFACEEIERRLDSDLRAKLAQTQIQTILAHVYFNQILMAETACFEDFLDILEGSVVAHFPALKREVERFICRELLVESADLAFVQKMILLAERFQLPVLKMVSAGALVDKLISTNESAESVSCHMREELLQIAEQITTDDDDGAESSGDETELLVHAVVNQLQSLAKSVRRVSLSASCGNLPTAPVPSSSCAVSGGTTLAPAPGPSSSTTPASVPAAPGAFFAAPLPLAKATQLANAGSTPPAGRRSSLKTSRELLSYGAGGGACSLDSDASSLNNSPVMGQGQTRRRSVLFSLQSFRFEDEEEESGVGSSEEALRRSPEQQFALEVSP